MYKLYVRLHSDYGNVVYHNQNSPLISKLESTQHAAAHLKLRKFDHRFNCNSPLCSCGQGSESTVHFSCTASLYIDLRRVLLDSVSDIIFNDVRVYPDQHMCHILLYDSESFNSVANRMILESSVRYIKDQKGFKV